MPYNFTTDYIDVCAYDLEDKQNKIAENEDKAKFAAEIERLERKARAEKQPRKMLDLFEQLKRLKNERT